MSQRYHAEMAWLGGATATERVLIEVAGDRITGVIAGVPAPPGCVRLSGLTMPGLANAHSHTFHRALRGRTWQGAASFESWRSLMYRVAERLDPDNYLALARAVYAEMALAGITAVGEFHYVHHGPGGRPYANPNEMGLALATAAEQVGIRLTLIDTCYLQADVDAKPLRGTQLRFGDRDGAQWQARAAQLQELVADRPTMRAGAAVHSVRAVSPAAAALVGAAARSMGWPLHVHLSEQAHENDACRAATGRTPAQLLAEAGVLGPATTAVHATHLTPSDIRLLADSGTGVCLCPTTEADLADGIGPSSALVAAGCRLSLGTDSQAAIDLLLEARNLEMHERLTSGRRDGHSPEALLAMASVAGMDALGWPSAGIATGGLADFFSITFDAVALAGVDSESALGMAVSAGTARDVHSVICGGRQIVAAGRHCGIEDVPGELAAAVRAVLG